MLSVLTLVYYCIRRLCRRRGVLPVLFSVPLAAALLRAAFAHSSWALTVAWACPFVCAALIWSVLHIQRVVDQATGLLAGFQSAPVTDSALLTSRILTAAFVFAVQMVIFGFILALRF